MVVDDGELPLALPELLVVASQVAQFNCHSVCDGTAKNTTYFGPCFFEPRNFGYNGKSLDIACWATEKTKFSNEKYSFKKSHNAEKCEKDFLGFLKIQFVAKYPNKNQKVPSVSSSFAAARKSCWLKQGLEPVTAGIPLNRLTIKWYIQGELFGLAKKEKTRAACAVKESV